MLFALFISVGASAQNKHSKTSRFPSYKGLIMAGYQGWHNTPEDGAGRGWGHYLQRGQFGPGNLKIDIWPTVNEYEKVYKTPFSLADGSPAYLPSDHDVSTTDVRFKWMKEYHLDGVFLQRFVGNTRRRNPAVRNHFLKVMGDALDASRKYGRAVGIMYDLSGMRDSADVPVLIDDWKNLVDSMKVTSRGNNQTYIYHNGKPLVVIWGVGFGDGRSYTTKSVSKFVDFLQNDPVYGGCAIMLGVPTYWRELGRDTEKNPALHDLIRKADLIHPWTIGRYGTEAAYQAYAEVQRGDFDWCKQNKVGYVPTVFPGFSWHNLNPGAKFDQIPRNRGRFFWMQLSNAIKQGAGQIYVAMYDEVDEGTAIMKVSGNPPVGPSPFVKFEEGIPNDYYLYLAGYAGDVLKKKRALPPSIPLPKNGVKSK
ncbi:xylosidase [Pedobacter sp. HMF7056]|uniref:Xylosidase n=1 Tax=Hufsiella ginkgonis TaxID=2695274 RepID=A0A7K1XTF7_9SPHI|nr:xylosidase [Hufsiella ginkgonis]